MALSSLFPGMKKFGKLLEQADTGLASMQKPF
jgi:hypothetical protein